MSEGLNPINIELGTASPEEVARAFDVSLEDAYAILAPFWEARDLVEHPFNEFGDPDDDVVTDDVPPNA